MENIVVHERNLPEKSGKTASNLWPPTSTATLHHSLFLNLNLSLPPGADCSTILPLTSTLSPLSLNLLRGGNPEARDRI